jgi:hypothetical protein
MPINNGHTYFEQNHQKTKKAIDCPNMVNVISTATSRF